MSQLISFAADGVLALLLCVTLVMAARLHRALRVVGRDRTAFEALVSSLSAATNSVRAGIQALRAEAERATAQIERRSEDADKMATDLSFLIEAADRACTRLEQRLVAETASASDGRKSSAAADRLKKSVEFLQKGPTKAASRPVEAVTLPVPAPTTFEPGLGSLTVETVPDDAPAALRELAGITTRRRGDQGIVRRGRSERHMETVVMEPVTAARETTQIKLVG